jgi:hypothetical protein
MASRTSCAATCRGCPGPRSELRTKRVLSLPRPTRARSPVPTCDPNDAAGLAALQGIRDSTKGPLRQLSRRVWPPTCARAAARRGASGRAPSTTARSHLVRLFSPGRILGRNGDAAERFFAIDERIEHGTAGNSLRDHRDSCGRRQPSPRQARGNGDGLSDSVRVIDDPRRGSRAWISALTDFV